MSSMIVFLIFIPILAFGLILLNVILSPRLPYAEKRSIFECGFHSFLGQNRQEFSVSFFVFGLLFLLFDLEILLIYPYVVSAYNNEVYGFVFALIFLAILTIGFVFEIGKGALKINSRQLANLQNSKTGNPVLQRRHYSTGFRQHVSRQYISPLFHLCQRRFFSSSFKQNISSSTINNEKKLSPFMKILINKKSSLLFWPPHTTFPSVPPPGKLNIKYNNILLYFII